MPRVIGIGPRRTFGGVVIRDEGLARHEGAAISRDARGGRA